MMTIRKLIIVLLSWFVRGICPSCGEKAQRGRVTCGDAKCEADQ